MADALLEAGAVQFVEALDSSENSALLESISKLDSITVFAPIDGALGGGNRKLMQDDRSGK